MYDLLKSTMCHKIVSLILHVVIAFYKCGVKILNVVKRGGCIPNVLGNMKYE